LPGVPPFRLDRVSYETVRRFALALAAIVLLAVVGASQDRLRVLSTLLAFNGLVVAVIAAMLRERIGGPTLTRWDEVLGFLVLFFAVRLVGF
jgi:hypothetical protein